MPGAIALLITAFVCLGVYADKKKARKVKLPAPVTAAVESAHPQSTIEKVKLEEEGLKLYEIELTQDDKEYELTITPLGKLRVSVGGVFYSMQVFRKLCLTQGRYYGLMVLL